MKDELQREYELRFANQAHYRDAVWKVLTADFFQQFISRDATLLDLGCGWGEFVNNIVASKKYGMDLNPDAKGRVASNVELLEQDCSHEWPLADESLDCVFTSNFFEHLRTKEDLRRTGTASPPLPSAGRTVDLHRPKHSLFASRLLGFLGPLPAAY